MKFSLKRPLSNRSRSAKPEDPDAIDPAVWTTAFSIIVGAMAVVFDTTIVSVAIHDLADDLHAPLGTIQWVTTGYLLAMFVTIPLAGWAQAALGGKRLWLVSLGAFLIGSILCAASWDAASLIVSRVVQGLGGGIMLPLMTTLIVQATGGRHIGRVMAAITLPTALGPIIGPVLGGVILAVADWRWLFLVNIPFCVIGAWLAYRNLPAQPSRRGVRLDLFGLLLVSPGVAAIVYALSQVQGSEGFASMGVLVPLGVGAVLLAGFVGWALRRGERALIDLRLFRHRNLTSGSVLGFLAGATLYGAMFLLPLYWQEVRGEDALGAGLLLIPQSLGTLLSRGAAGRYTDRFGPRWVALAGFVIVTVSTIPFAFVTADTSYVLLLVTLFSRGIGMGVAIIPLTGASFIGLPHDDTPGASIITRVAQQLGGSIGTAVIAVVLQNASASSADLDDIAHGFGSAFWWAIAFTAVAAPVCLLMPGRPPATAVPATAAAG
ncbi:MULTISPECIES: MDR family MFS transporter [unclassified Saccharopolyspora]|uniref:MDR family MFS transporter n=1 Tax=unclassified Saccharopolyspora TaxID=2646250 RepID=UPI001CD2160B|nr:MULTISPECIES: MDR family MFS transporter [unclassified Saccharopolyspora]MCA1186982.1 multidrug efflux MFS transporter [Saccharopolyspora sp. 6T]MCA1192639.1 multidrug efflux MFS transporter [Saccharopolyspora sp. 6V]MCA1229629.1 multidrug efflux MFS transporter [Saccharopolyspora sp. 6M]MCA1283469.1 multidrug efflux MFS transporter [Saccharopolyspora sp. 7B]